MHSTLFLRVLASAIAIMIAGPQCCLAKASSAGLQSQQGITSRAEIVGQEESKAIDDMVRFVDINARLAGAESVCEPAVANMLKACTQASLAAWPQISGTTAFRDQNAVTKLGNSTWQRAFSQAHDEQSNLQPPMTCAAVARAAAHAPVLEVCEPVGGIRSGLPNSMPQGQHTRAQSSGIKIQ